jgi:hypothetical protein
VNNNEPEAFAPGFFMLYQVVENALKAVATLREINMLRFGSRLVRAG